MNIPTHFEGEIYFYWSTEYEWIQVWHKEMLDDNEHVFIGKSAPIKVEFNINQGTQKAVESLEKQIEKERAESACRVQILKDRISSLLALEHKPEVKA